MKAQLELQDSVFHLPRWANHSKQSTLKDIMNTSCIYHDIPSGSKSLFFSFDLWTDWNIP